MDGCSKMNLTTDTPEPFNAESGDSTESQWEI
jgi:hypothetical protein